LLKYSVTMLCSFLIIFKTIVFVQKTYKLISITQMLIGCETDNTYVDVSMIKGYVVNCI